jgi:threonylcarbamoyladenosine tRNA methylthiotransferase MtaB
VRPGLRSRSPQDIEDEVRRLIDSGHKEIVLAGIHVGHYGVEASRGRSGRDPFRLWHLFERLDAIPGDWRMRLSSIEAVEINEDFINAAANCEHLCPQFHPSLQSGSVSVLRRMRRRYTIANFLDTLERMRQRLDRPAFTTDVIVGFPGETEAEFEETLKACRDAGFMKIHIFPFSARRGTPAASFADQVPPEVRKARCDRLAELERELAMRLYAQHIGDELEVLVEQPVADEPNWYVGTDRRYMPVKLRCESADVGRFAKCVGSTVYRDYLEAELCESLLTSMT